MPRKATGPEAMTPAERAAKSRARRTEEHARLRMFAQWVIDNHTDTKLIARARAALDGRTPAPKPHAPQTLARDTVRPMFKAKAPTASATPAAPGTPRRSPR